MAAVTPAGWLPDHDRLRRRMADRLRARGHPQPELAAALFAVRGVLRMDRRAFAEAMGVDEQRIAACERGDGSLAG